MDKLRVSIIGTGGISRIYAASLRAVPNADLVACASATQERAEEFAKAFNIPRWFGSYEKMLEMRDIDLVLVGAPNFLHARMTIDSANAGKHVCCVKPLCMNMHEAEKMIEACTNAHVWLAYGDNICFSPKYRKLNELCTAGALGRLYHLRQTAKHRGPPSEWFWDTEKSGGWATMDLACHAFQFFRWMYRDTEVKSVFAEMGNHVHVGRGKGDDNAIIVVTFKNGSTALAEASWGKGGGFEDTGEAYGTNGVCYARLPFGTCLETYSETGYHKSHYVMELAGKGWSFATYEEEWHYGFPQMLHDCVESILGNRPPLFTGNDGKAVMEMIMAAYASAKEGRKIGLPFTTDARKPIDLWLSG